jgi:hypothetical protein
MATFQEMLANLPEVEELSHLELYDASGQMAACIENKAGSQGSLRVYHYLARSRGCIGPAEAEEGLRLFAEHTEDARKKPGAHPNIDRLLWIIDSGETYTVQSFVR